MPFRPTPGADVTELLPSFETSEGITVDASSPGLLFARRRIIRAAGITGHANTTTETTAWTPGTVVIAPGTMTTETTLELRGSGGLLNNTGGSTTTTVRIKAGGSPVAAVALVQPTSSATQRAYEFILRLRRGDIGPDSYLLADGAVQRATLNNLGSLSSVPFTITPISFDPAAPLALSMTVAHSAAHASLQIGADFTYLELLRSQVNA